MNLKKIFANKKNVIISSSIVLLLVIALFFSMKPRTFSYRDYQKKFDKLVISSEKEIHEKWTTMANDQAVIKLALYSDKTFDIAISNLGSKQDYLMSGKWRYPGKNTLRLQFTSQDQNNQPDKINGQQEITLTINNNSQPAMLYFNGLLLVKV